MKFVILVDGKPFIKGYDKGEVPDVRLDLKFKKHRSLKMCIKQEQLDDLAKHSATEIMSHFPDLTEEQIKKSIEITKETKNPKALPKLYFEKYNEGTSVQIMYLGSYSDEGPTIKLMHDYANDEGYSLNGKHHEIYLGDPRKTAPEKLKTVIRQPISYDS